MLAIASGLLITNLEFPGGYWTGLNQRSYWVLDPRSDIKQLYQRSAYITRVKRFFENVNVWLWIIHSRQILAYTGK